MKKLLAIALLGLTLGGCQFFKNVETAFQLGTASVANPVTTERLYQLESGISIVFSGLRAWKQSCVQGLIPPDCKRQIGIVQTYTRQIPPYLAQLRTFVRTNDQVNAVVLFNQITEIVATVKAQAALNNGS